MTREQEIADIKKRLIEIIKDTTMPISYGRCEADSDFSLGIFSPTDIVCGGYAWEEFGTTTTLESLSLFDLAGIVDIGRPMDDEDKDHFENLRYDTEQEDTGQEEDEGGW